jgi:hypothetical protein
MAERVGDIARFGNHPPENGKGMKVYREEQHKTAAPLSTRPSIQLKIQYSSKTTFYKNT